jgi:hypothetical protein
MSSAMGIPANIGRQEGTIAHRCRRSVQANIADNMAICDGFDSSMASFGLQTQLALPHIG